MQYLSTPTIRMETIHLVASRHQTRAVPSINMPAVMIRRGSDDEKRPEGFIRIVGDYRFWNMNCISFIANFRPRKCVATASLSVRP